MDAECVARAEHTVIVHAVRFRLTGTHPLLISENYYNGDLCRGGPCPLHHLRAVSLKKVAVRAARLLPRMSMAYVRGGMFVVNYPIPILRNGVPYTDETAHIEEVPFRIGRSETTVRSIRVYDPWEVEFCVHYNTSALAEEKVVELFQLAGYYTGLGCPPPERNEGLEGNFQVRDVVSFGEVQRFTEEGSG